MTNLCIVLHIHTLLSCFFLACIHVVKPGSNCVSAINVNDFLILYSGLFTTGFVTSCQVAKINKSDEDLALLTLTAPPN